MTEMHSVDHTNPHTGEAFVATLQRGVLVAADGGERAAGPAADEAETAADASRDADEEVMEDVAHESETEGANRSFERGTEGKDESV